MPFAALPLRVGARCGEPTAVGHPGLADDKRGRVRGEKKDQLG